MTEHGIEHASANERPANVLLIGGGHAHVAVLADWIENGLPAERTTLVTPSRHLRYSGMVPGWISGQYDRDTGLVDVAALARRAGTDLVLDRCSGIDLAARCALLAGGGSVSFEIASIDTGGVGQAHRVLDADDRLIDIRPIDAFVDKLETRLAVLEGSPEIAVIGGGAGGVELAFAMRNRGAAREGSGPPNVTLIAGKGGVTPSFSSAVRKKVEQALKWQGIEVLAADARFDDGVLYAGEDRLETPDLIVAAIGSTAPDWPANSGLACDKEGFILVDEHQQSHSHPNIFAVGDVAMRTDADIPHSGVHAVYAGPILADNLRAAAGGRAPRRRYLPRGRNLYLMSTGDGSAIASYGPFAAESRLIAKIKHWIDARWISKYADLAKNM
ncbi:FAD-dependent oxidoreductase [Erythrobacter sp. MTPC3]